jgi:hypothetical protein
MPSARNPFAKGDAQLAPATAGKNGVKKEEKGRDGGRRGEGGEGREREC